MKIDKITIVGEGEGDYTISLVASPSELYRIEEALELQAVEAEDYYACKRAVEAGEALRALIIKAAEIYRAAEDADRAGICKLGGDYHEGSTK